MTFCEYRCGSFARGFNSLKQALSMMMSDYACSLSSIIRVAISDSILALNSKDCIVRLKDHGIESAEDMEEMDEETLLRIVFRTSDVICMTCGAFSDNCTGSCPNCGRRKMAVSV